MIALLRDTLCPEHQLEQLEVTPEILEALVNIDAQFTCPIENAACQFQIVAIYEIGRCPSGTSIYQQVFTTEIGKQSGLNHFTGNTILLPNFRKNILATLRMEQIGSRKNGTQRKDLLANFCWREWHID